MLKYTIALLMIGCCGYLGASGNPSGELETLTVVTSRILSRSVDFLKKGIDNAPEVSVSQWISPALSLVCVVLWLLSIRLGKGTDVRTIPPTVVVEQRQEEPKVVQEAKARTLKGQLQADKHILECKQRTLCEVIPKTKDELSKAQKSLMDAEKSVEYKRQLVRELFDKLQDQQSDFLSNERDLKAIAVEMDKIKSVV